MDFHGFGPISGPDLGRIWVGFGYVSLCKTFWKPSGTAQEPPGTPSTIPGWFKNWLGVSWGSPGGPLGSPGGPLGGVIPGDHPWRMIPRLSKPIFGAPGDDPGGGPQVVPNAYKWVQMLANGSRGARGDPFYQTPLATNHAA